MRTKSLSATHWLVLLWAISLAVLCGTLLLAQTTGGRPTEQPTPPHAGRTATASSTPRGGITAAPNTIFLDTAPVSFDLRADGNVGTVVYTVTDLDGASVMQGQGSVWLGAFHIALGQVGDGYYVLRILDQTVSPATTQDIPFGVVAPDTPAPDTLFGVAAHFSKSYNPNLVPLAATLGVGQIRDDVRWRQIETSPGHYVFPARYDIYMNELAATGLSPLVVLDDTNPLYDHNYTPYDDVGMAAFAHFAQAVLRHYGSRVKVVEVYNEYNTNFSTGPCAQSPTCYARLLQYTYEAIKAIRPDVTVVGGAVSLFDLTWFDHLFQAGGLRYMDVVSDHPYTTNAAGPPESGPLDQQMWVLEQEIKRYNGGQPKPIWITELGWHTCCDGVDEHTQAAYGVRGALLALAGGVQRFVWYDLLDDGTDPNNTEQHWGLLHASTPTGLYTPKPAYVAYAVLIRQLSEATFVRDDSAGSVRDEMFTQADAPLRVLWSTAGTQYISFSTSNPIAVTTMTGASTTYAPTAGTVTLTIDGDPIYVSGTVGPPRVGV